MEAPPAQLRPAVPAAPTRAAGLMAEPDHPSPSGRDPLAGLRALGEDAGPAPRRRRRVGRTEITAGDTADPPPGSEPATGAGAPTTRHRHARRRPNRVRRWVALGVAVCVLLVGAAAGYAY